MKVAKEHIFRSGKYKGRTYNEVQISDPNYIDWVIENRPEMLQVKKPAVTDGLTPREKFALLMPNNNFDKE